MKARKDIRKLIKDGSSTVVTIPPEFLENNNLERGDQIELIYNGVLVVKPLDPEAIELELGEVKENHNYDERDQDRKKE